MTVRMYTFPIDDVGWGRLRLSQVAPRVLLRGRGAAPLGVWGELSETGRIVRTVVLMTERPWSNLVSKSLLDLLFCAVKPRCPCLDPCEIHLRFRGTWPHTSGDASGWSVTSAGAYRWLGKMSGLKGTIPACRKPFVAMPAVAAFPYAEFNKPEIWNCVTALPG